jgi:hypothetical protein
VPLRPPHRPGVTTWLVAWLVFSALGGLWAISSPLFNVPDEPSHTVYAAAAVRGEIWAPAEGLRTTVTVPATYRNAHDVFTCYVFDVTIPAGCAAAFVAVDGTAEVVTTAGRYPPAYYMYAGLGSLVTDGAKAVYAMRLLTAVAVGAFLASAFCSILARRGRAFALVGLGLATTPMLFYFAGSINPQAPEIAASILLWTSGSALLLAMKRDGTLPLTFRNPDLRRVLAAVVTLPLLRPMSLFWLALIVGALLLSFGSWVAMRRLLTARAVLITLPVFAAAVGLNFVWILFRDALLQQDVTAYAGSPRGEALLFSTAKLNEEYMHMIGYFGWLTTPAPGLVYVLYTALLGGLLALRIAARGRQLVAVGLLTLAVLVLPVALEWSTYEVSAFAWQGRYTLPIAVGIPLLLGTDEDSSFRTSIAAKRFLTVAAVGTAVIHFLSYAGTLNRNVFGINGFWGLTPQGWAPPLPAWSLMVGGAAAAVVVAVAMIRSGAPTDMDVCRHDADLDRDPVAPLARSADERSESTGRMELPQWADLAGTAPDSSRVPR